MTIVEFLPLWGLNTACEYLVWVLWLRRIQLTDLYRAALINTLTQPIAIFIYHQWLLMTPQYSGGHLWVPFSIVESGVILLEWFLLFQLLRIRRTRALWISLTANGLTAALGLFI